MEAKDFIRPPFATYDIVVYFGCGLFCLPLIFHYFIEPTKLRFPRFQFNIGIEFADVAVSTLSLLFAVYILGHMIAHIASHAIEKTVDLFFGKISTALIISSLTKPEDFGETIQAWIIKKFKSAFSKGHKISSGLRTIFFLPVFPVCLFLIGFRQVEYFRSRVPPKVFAQVKKRSVERGFGQVSLRSKWYKAIEHDVMNNHPVPVARMYNYLVISGIFRSLALIFLACAWCELYFWLHRIIHGHELVKSLMSDKPVRYGHVLTLLGFNILFGFSISAYLKFARRYVEEAVFSFVLTREPSAVGSS